MSTSALAATYSDPYVTPSIKGYTYSFTSEVWDRYPPGSHSTVEAVCYVKTDNNVPIGYMGGQARLFGIDGQIRQASSMTYNSKSIAGMFVYSPATANGNTYYAYSRAEFYNGNGYTTFTGYKYPVLKHPFIKNMNTTDTPTAIKNLMAKTEYEVNDNGETYGSALSAYTIGAEPDLISAVGTNGVEGYVRADDLTPKVSSIEEALEQNAENGDVRTIPLYAEDGETVLGEFELVTNIEYDIDTN